MSIDTPASIAVIGGGPIGLEAALYARYLGYNVALYEAATVAANVERVSHLPLTGTWSQLTSPLGRAALHCQNPDREWPSDDQRLSARQWIDLYLRPLARTDLLDGHVHLAHRVISVGRNGLNKTDDPCGTRRWESDFCLLVESEGHGPEWRTADVVIDVSGRSHPLGGGPGGLSAIGEQACRDHIHYVPPNLTTEDHRSRLMQIGPRWLLVGRDPSIAVTIAQLRSWQASAKALHITWIPGADKEGEPPICRDAVADRSRHDQIEQANNVARQPPPGWQVVSTSHVARLTGPADDKPFRVWFAGDTADTEPAVAEFDHLVVQTGARGDVALFAELPVAMQRDTETPSPVDGHSVDWFPDVGEPVSRLLTSEPDFYIVGAKRRGRLPGFQFRDGLDEIRDLFSLIGGRADLDLYAQLPDG